MATALDIFASDEHGATSSFSCCSIFDYAISVATAGVYIVVAASWIADIDGSVFTITVRSRSCAIYNASPVLSDVTHIGDLSFCTCYRCIASYGSSALYLWINYAKSSVTGPIYVW